MRTKNMLASGALAALTVAIPTPSEAGVPVWRFHADHVLDTSLDVTAIAPDEATATMAAEAARAEMRAKLDDIASVTVMADRDADVDALATAFSVMSIDESLALADGLPGVAASITTLDGAIRTSAQWGAWTVNSAGQQPKAPVLLAQNTQGQSGPAWPVGYALSIQYEVPEVSGGRYRRPYLAIWITDSSGRPVRTVLLLGTRPGWQRDNYLWSRQYASRQPDMVDAVSRPTRARGRYTATWDGTDDAGRNVPQGMYTIHVEAARQYGGHSYGYADLELFDGATQREMRPREEFGGLRMTYGPIR